MLLSVHLLVQPVLLVLLDRRLRGRLGLLALQRGLALQGTRGAVGGLLLLRLLPALARLTATRSGAGAARLAPAVGLLLRRRRRGLPAVVLLQHNLWRDLGDGRRALGALERLDAVPQRGGDLALAAHALHGLLLLVADARAPSEVAQHGADRLTVEGNVRISGHLALRSGGVLLRTPLLRRSAAAEEGGHHPVEVAAIEALQPLQHSLTVNLSRHSVSLFLSVRSDLLLWPPLASIFSRVSGGMSAEFLEEGCELKRKPNAKRPPFLTAPSVLVCSP